MSGRIYVGRLSYRASERDIEHFFRGYGRIKDIVLKNGFGFVEFDDSRDADDAVYELNGKELCGERVILEFSRRGPRGGAFDRDRDRGRDRGDSRGDGRGPPPRRDSRYGPPQQTRHRVIVENISSRCSWQDLKDIMRAAGEVTFADAHKQHKNEGIVCYASRSDLERAMETLQGKEVNGRRLKLIDDTEGTTRKSRSRSRSPRRSKSKSRSKSRSPRSARSSRSRHSSRSHSKSKSPVAKKEGSRSRSASAESRNGHDNEHSKTNGDGGHGDNNDESMKNDRDDSPARSNKSNDD